MSESSSVTKPQTHKEKLEVFASKARKKVGELAARTFEAEKTTQKVTRALKSTEMENQELAALLRSQNEQVVQHTGVGHKAGVDVTGMALAAGLDLAAFEGLVAASNWSFVAKYRKVLSGAPHLLLGVPGYAAALVKRAGSPGFPSMVVEVGEETAKHLIVLGLTNIGKQFLAA